MTATFVQAGPYEIPDSLASTRARSCEATDRATRSIMNVRENRKSTCCIRSSYTVLGAIRGIWTVPFGPDDRLRMSDGTICALVNVAVAEYTMPGRFWYVVATWKS